ncbi:MAG: BREX-2 system adenine-specific DNA-methyltransferase PglX, partial [Streptosporangiaceae bacterium]
MTATPALTADLQRQVLLLEDDLRDRVAADPGLEGRWKQEHQRALDKERTAASWVAWRDDRVTQAAVAWVLTSVFIRFCEDNALVGPVWIAGPDHRRQEALDAQLAFFRTHPLDTDREWLRAAIDHLAALPATRGLVDSRSALHLVAPSGSAVTKLLDFWRDRGEGDALVHDLADTSLSTRFLGDLYQDLSQHAKETYALLQTPVFVEEFILDRTLEPALKERPLEGFRLIDPTCGSGHFLLGAFDRLLDRWHRHAPGLELQARVQAALDAIHGVDLNPFAVAIARFRLTVAALTASGLTSLETAPAFTFHLAVGDSLIHGPDPDVLPGMGDRTAYMSFTYATEDGPLLLTILEESRYDVVVGNPPYITVKDKALNQIYRSKYANVCKGTYAMTVPFMALFFSLAKQGDPVGWVGQITSNSFMKREFGTKLIEDFLAHQDLRLVADISGAFIPGHGTPTVIIVGRNQGPAGSTVRAVLGVRGEPGRPENPAKGIVWTSIVEHIDDPGWDDGWITIVDLDRSLLAAHPWSLTGGGAVSLLATIQTASRAMLSDRGVTIGRTTHTGSDECFYRPRHAFATPGLVTESVPVVLGEDVRDYQLDTPVWTLFPYTGDGQPRLPEDKFFTAVWPLRTVMAARVDYEQTLDERGLRWFDHSMFFAKRFRVPLSIAFAFVATHNHFVLDRGGKVFKQSAPVIKLPLGATEDEHLGLLGVLNSSTACFWLKQVCHDKGIRGEGGGFTPSDWERFYEFTGTTLQDYPLPNVLPLARGRTLDFLAQELATRAASAVCARQIPAAGSLSAACSESDDIRAQMITLQEELDWETYRLYGLINEDLTYSGDDLPPLALGQRSFEIGLACAVQAGEEEPTWFIRHASTPITEIPAHWPAAYQELVQRRLNFIVTDPTIRLLERPEYKRRWAQEPWEKQKHRALREWVLDRLEDRRFWFDALGRPLPRSVAQLADDVTRDTDIVSVLALWEGRPDVPVTQSLVRLLADEVVPYLAAYRYKDSGLRKREAWEETWRLQRAEDAGERVG